MKIGERITFECVKQNGGTPCEGCFFNKGDICGVVGSNYFNCGNYDGCIFVEVKDDKA